MLNVVTLLADRLRSWRLLPLNQSLPQYRKQLKLAPAIQPVPPGRTCDAATTRVLRRREHLYFSVGVHVALQLQRQTTFPVSSMATETEWILMDSEPMYIEQEQLVFLNLLRRGTEKKEEEETPCTTEGGRSWNRNAPKPTNHSSCGRCCCDAWLHCGDG